MSYSQSFSKMISTLTPPGTTLLSLQKNGLEERMLPHCWLMNVLNSPAFKALQIIYVII